MTCPHCGAEAPEGPKFCPSCSRLLDSPLLRIKQELDAARGKPLHQQVAESTAERARALAARTAVVEPPPMPEQPPVYRLQNAGPTPARDSDVQDRLREMQARNKKGKKGRREPQPEESHSAPDHRFRQTTHQHGAADAAQQHNAKQRAQKSLETAAKAAKEVPPPPERFPRPAAVMVLGLLDVFAALLLFGVGAQLTMQVPEPRPPLVDMVRYVWFGLAGFFLLTGFAMWGRWRIGRLMQMLTALPMLVNYPMGSIYGVVLLLFLKGTTTQAIFQGKSPRQLTPAQWASAHGTLRFSPVLAVLFVIFALFPFTGLATLFHEYVPRAAMMIEQAKAGAPIDAILQTAQTGVPVIPPDIVESEPSPTGDPQTTAADDVVAVMRAQAAYASLNGGFYDRIECVVTPANCIPNGDPRNAAKLLEQRYTRMERNGYVFQLRLSEAPETRPDTVSKTGTSEYAYRAVPIKGEGPGFCGDQTGTICTFDSKNVTGNPFKCPEACTPLQRTEPQ